jgi:hypothetical protein
MIFHRFKINDDEKQFRAKAQRRKSASSQRVEQFFASFGFSLPLRLGVKRCFVGRAHRANLSFPI